MSNWQFFKKILQETKRGKGSGRILFNLLMDGRKFGGKILDIGGGKDRSSVYRFLKLEPGAVVKKADINLDFQPDYLVNMEKDTIPAPDNYFDNIFSFSLIEHLASHEHMLKEVYRLLKPGGTFAAGMPFLANFHPDPHDYVRFSKEKIELVLKEAGFKNIKIEEVGRGPFTASWYLLEFIFPWWLRLVFMPLVLSLDYLLQKIKPKINFKERYPTGYYFEAKKI